MWYIRTTNKHTMWWAGHIEKVLERRSDQQWSHNFYEATAYVDAADAVYACFILGEADLVMVFRD